MGERHDVVAVAVPPADRHLDFVQPEAPVAGEHDDVGERCGQLFAAAVEQVVEEHRLELRADQQVAGAPLRLVASQLIRLIRPVAEPALYAYARISPEADRRLLVRPEFKAMFLDDLLNGSRKQLAAPFADVVVFARDWGFRLDEVKVPIRWWHGDRDHIVPFEHGQHVVSRLPDAQLTHLPGESHLAGLGRAEEILGTMVELWDRVDQK